MLVPVILSGTRLWPVSREAYPKPFIRLADGKTLLRKTLERAHSVRRRLDCRHRDQQRALLHHPRRAYGRRAAR